MLHGLDVLRTVMEDLKIYKQNGLGHSAEICTVYGLQKCVFSAVCMLIILL